MDRESFFYYFSGGGDLTGLRYDNWKLVFLHYSPCFRRALGRDLLRNAG